MTQYVLARHIATKYATRIETVHIWNRSGLLPVTHIVWVGRANEHAWEKDAFENWEPPYRGYRKRLRIWESRDWGDGTDTESEYPSADISSGVASVEALGYEGSDISVGAPSVGVSVPDAVRYLATRHSVSERTARNWIIRRGHDLCDHRGRVDPVRLDDLEPPAGGRRPARG